MTDIIFGALDALDSVTRAEEGVWMNVLSPNGNQALSPSGIPIRIKFCGADSVPFQEEMNRRARAAVQKAQTRQSAATPNNPGVSDVIAEAVTLLVHVARGWEGFETPDSTKEAPNAIPFTQDALRSLLTRYPSIREQSDRFVSNRANFFLKPVES